MDNLFDPYSQIFDLSGHSNNFEQIEVTENPEIASQSSHSPAAVENAHRALLSLEAAIDTFARTDFSALTRDQRLDLSARLFKGITRMGALRSSLLTVIERAEDWKGSGSRTFSEFETKSTGTSLATSRAQIKSAATREEKLPHVKKALLAGDITNEHARLLERVAQNDDYSAKLQSPSDGEAKLVEKAKSMDAGAFAKAVKKWQITNAPTQAEKEHRLAQQEEKLVIVEDTGGWRISGWLAALNGQIVNTALSAAMGIPSLEDPRTPPLRRANALVEICRNGIDTGVWSGTARVRPHVSVHIQHETLTALIEATRASGMVDSAGGVGYVGGVGHLGDGGDGSACGSVGSLASGTGDVRIGESDRSQLHLLECHHRSTDNRGRTTGPADRAHGVECNCLDRIKDLRAEVGEFLGQIRAGFTKNELEKLTGVPPAELDDGTPLLPTETQTLLCNSELQRILFSTEGEVLDVGREHRLCTNRQVRAVIARDRHCRYPGCSETIGTSHIHHAIPWESGGQTDIDNLVMLCWHHHRVVHSESVTIHHHRNGFVFTKPRSSMSSPGSSMSSSGSTMSSPRSSMSSPRSSMSSFGDNTDTTEIIIGYSIHPACAEGLDAA